MWILLWFPLLHHFHGSNDFNLAYIINPKDIEEFIYFFQFVLYIENHWKYLINFLFYTLNIVVTAKKTLWVDDEIPLVSFV